MNLELIEGLIYLVAGMAGSAAIWLDVRWTKRLDEKVDDLSRRVDGLAFRVDEIEREVELAARFQALESRLDALDDGGED